MDRWICRADKWIHRSTCGWAGTQMMDGQNVRLHFEFYQKESIWNELFSHSLLSSWLMQLCIKSLPLLWGWLINEGGGNHTVNMHTHQTSIVHQFSLECAWTLCVNPAYLHACLCLLNIPCHWSADNRVLQDVLTDPKRPHLSSFDSSFLEIPLMLLQEMCVCVWMHVCATEGVIQGMLQPGALPIHASSSQSSSLKTKTP